MLNRRYFCLATIASAPGRALAQSALFNAVSFNADPSKGDHQAEFEEALRTAKTLGLPIQVTGIVKQTRPFELHNGAVIQGNISSIYPNYWETWQDDNVPWPKSFATFQYVTGRHGATFSEGQRCRIENIIIRRAEKFAPNDTVFPKGKVASHVHMRGCFLQNMEAIASDTVRGFGAWQFEQNTIMGCNYGFAGIVVDMKIIGNTFVSMKKNVLRVDPGGGLNIMSLNRVEWGMEPYVLLGKNCRVNSFVGNIFDACGKAAIALIEASDGQVISDNIFWRNSRLLKDPGVSSHIVISKSGGHRFSNNHFIKGRPDNGGDQFPATVVRFLDCVGNPSIFDHIAADACTSTTVLAAEGTSARAVDVASIDLPMGPDPGSNSDDLGAALKNLQTLLASPTNVRIDRSRSVLSNVGYCDKIYLEGEGEGEVELNLSDYALGFLSVNNITIGSISYQKRGDSQIANKLPAESGSDGLWRIGQILLVPKSDDKRVIWVCVAEAPTMKWGSLPLEVE
ncbi:hypothetical protein [Neorhizobium sp. NCHU2750]|uniref:hypothetical protein n=1 Tax=Neorhizobium sp. NCHU2750 TaxID=1825976 RepID=UPI000EB706D8|nr:pectate lyase [Neorhizobium sp. NCHU2750]